MNDAEIVIAVKSDGTGARVIKRDLDEIASGGEKAKKSVDRLSQAMKGLIGFFGAREIIRFSDSITMLETKLRNVTRGTSDYTQKFDALFKIAQKNGDAFGGIADTFVRLNTSLPDSIRYTTDLTKVTELLSRGMAASGASTQTASAVMTQLTQGLSSNFANASQELNSLIEGTPLLARLISEQLGGKSASDLKKLAEAGELTSEAFLKATLDAEGAINKFAIPPTIERSWNRIKNAFMEMGSESGVVEGAARALASVMDTLAKNVDLVANAVLVAASAWAAYWVTVNIGAFTGVASAIAGNVAAFVSLAGTVRNVTSAVALLNAAFMIGPAGLVGILAAVTTGIFLLSDGFMTAKNSAEINATAVDTLKEAQDRLNGKLPDVTAAVKADTEEKIRNAQATLKAAEAEIKLLEAKILSPNYGGFELAKTGINVRAQAEERLSNVRGEAERVRAEIEKTQADLEKFLKNPPKVSGGLTEPTKAAKKAQDELTKAIKASRTEEEQLLDAIKELENMRGLAKTTGQAAELEEAIRRANGELDELRVQAERNGPVAKAFESLVSQIDDGFRDAFRNAFTGAKSGWEGLMDGMKATFKTVLADLAYMAFARPIVAQIVGVAGGVMGVSSGAQASILGDVMGAGGMGGFSLGNMGSLLSNGWSAISGGLNSPIFSAGSMIGKGINSIGSALGLNNANFIGPMLPGTSNLASAFTPMAGIAGFGGNMLADLIFGSGRGWGSTIGGTLGAVGGTAIGASMGTILGMAGGPIGALAGGFLGNALGGLFGGKKPSDKAQWGGLDLGTLKPWSMTGQSGSKYSAENAKFRDSVITEAQNLAAILKDAGAELEGKLFIHVGNRDGLRVGTGYKQNYKNFGNNQTAFINEVMRRVVTSATGLEQTFKTILEKVGHGDTAKLAEAFEFGKFYESLVNPVDEVESALKAVNEQFDALAKKALDLGLQSDVFTAALEKQREASLGAVKAMEAGFQSMEAMKATFDSWLYDQSLSGTSSLSPMQKLQAAQGNFGDLLTKAQGGDYSVTQQLLQSGQQLLAIGQSMYASSVDFASLEHFVRESIKQIAKDLEIPGYAVGTRSARSGMAWVGERGPELVNFNGGERVYTAEESKSMARQSARQDADIAAMKGNMSDMSDSMARMERQINRLTNSMIASKGVISV